MLTEPGAAYFSRWLRILSSFKTPTATLVTAVSVAVLIAPAATDRFKPANITVSAFDGVVNNASKISGHRKRLHIDDRHFDFFCRTACDYTALLSNSLLSNFKAILVKFL
jgi:hypothetical protein